MEIKENIPLASLTTFKIGGPARYVVECFSLDDVREAVALAAREKLPLIPLGQGSNILASDDRIEAVVIRMRIPGMSWEEIGGDFFVEVGAGVAWDVFVDETCNRGLWGVENLAGIPGTVGASPVQNIGAYGSDVSETITTVEVFDIATGSTKVIDVGQCGFSYRDSIFKHSKNFIILRVTFRLSKEGMPHIHYADLTKYKDDGGTLGTPQQIAQAVRSIRSMKFPDLTLWGTAGSFFKNPTLSETDFNSLKEKFPDLPGFQIELGVKVPLAWILDHILNLRGYTLGDASLFQNQPLVLVATEDSTAVSVEALARDVEQKVLEATGVNIEREVRSL